MFVAHHLYQTDKRNRAGWVRLIGCVTAATVYACSSEATFNTADSVEHAIAASPSSLARPQTSAIINSGVRLERIDTYGHIEGNRSRPQRRSATVRVVLWLTGPAPYRRGELAASADGIPRRLFLDLEQVTLGANVRNVLPVGSGGLLRIRSFALGPTTTRISFDVERTTACRVFSLVHPYRIVMDFRAGDPPAIPRVATEPLVIALDPGHGGNDFGAVSESGLKESVLALDVARRVKDLLRASLARPRVVMTREGNRTVALEERTAIANGYEADLFVSIHFNASHSSDEIGGVATYIIDTGDRAQALSLAASENGITEQEVTGLQAIVASLYRKDQVERSLRLAKTIQRRTLAAGRVIAPRLADRGTNPALFYVLIGARMPSVLVEASYIRRAHEAQLLSNESYRQALANGIARGIIDYVRSNVKKQSVTR